ncbi:glycoside hydrolase family 1 protein [Medicago truncatula]|uniref:Glycoside hydrolase family 1 protein n=1 Tax=Medicago truncatula TaxID=3880 RepID=A0A072V654_MEDTR|nr:glycoside hydrolase family 1 protein [Medicago truncatula]
MGILRESLLLLPLIFDVYRTKYQTALAWLYVHPQGMENIVTYIKERYNNVPIFITKNGFRTSENSHPTTEDELNDVKRVEYMYMSSYLDSLATAISTIAVIDAYDERSKPEHNSKRAKEQLQCKANGNKARQAAAKKQQRKQVQQNKNRSCTKPATSYFAKRDLKSIWGFGVLPSLLLMEERENAFGSFNGAHRRLRAQCWNDFSSNFLLV